MADATQVQRRRGTASQCNAMTPAEGEIIVDLTADTTRVGDGSRAGGFIQPNFNHVQQNTFTFATTSGTANAITLTTNPAVLSYGPGLGLIFIPAVSNTSSVTVNVSGLGNLNLLKPTDSGLVALEANDLIAGVAYNIICDGSQFQLPAAVGKSGVWEKISEGNIPVMFNPSISIPSGYNSYDILLENIVITGVSPSILSPISIPLDGGSVTGRAVSIKIDGSGSQQVCYAFGGTLSTIAVRSVSTSLPRISSIEFTSSNVTGGTYKIYGRK